MAQKSASRVSRPAQIRALASPIRQEILDTLVTLGGEAAVATLAEQLGRPADGLYYHLRLLRTVGLVHEIESESGGERRYALVGGEPKLVYRPEDRRNAEAIRRVAQGLLQIGRRDFERALASPDTVVDGPDRQLWAARMKGWVSESEIREINRLLERLNALLSQPRSKARRTLLALAYVLAPLAPQPKRRE